ncbi:hypothetical protein Pla52n_60110 [Stieleria varia]|uniref:Uncharacterized protein n=1 Tax=Stieleria varia TaxID=2528005 RepID=A0A5C6A292_9BACT|nr:hypothetical protein Pla52n_60110 [Stieleria varia]
MRRRLSRNFWDKDADGKSVSPPKGSTVTDNRAWELKETVAVRGSVHSDCWSGTAVQLASSNLISVYPVTGWWRYRRDQKTVEKMARYSLIVSISTDDSEVDLRAIIANEIQARIDTKAAIETRIDV